MIRHLALCFGLVALTLGSAWARPAVSDRIVLPDGVDARHYDLTLTADPNRDRFEGVVTITLDLSRPRTAIVLNALELTITSASLSDGTKPKAITFDETREEVTLTFAHALKAGEHKLTIAYSGKIETTARGLFVSAYRTPEGEKRMLTTQFEPSDARRMLPCFDEPARKATFAVTAIIPKDLTALSNMPETSRQIMPGGPTKVTFKTSPKMSTYLLFFGLGDFERKSRMVAGVDVGVVTKRGDLDKASFALDAAAKVLPFYNDYFGTPYPLPKLDLIAVPAAGGFGAMENWGAVLYFEPVMLIDPRLSTATDEQRVFVVIAHETAHQWFGNLVTMDWWDDLWLNEGYASWMENKATDHFHPEWRMWAQAEGARQSAIVQDARTTTHPIVQHVRNAAEANQAFDDITYRKGQAVIRMIEAHVGPDVFRAGVRAYMAKHAYGNTVTTDLWRALEAAGGKDVLRIAHDFTTIPGVPLVKVATGPCVKGSTDVTLTQGRYDLAPRNDKPPVWTLPLTLGNGEVQAKVINKGTSKVRLASCAPIIVNLGQNAYVMAAYDRAGAAGVAQAYPKLETVDQLGVLAGAWRTGLVGLQPMSDVLALAEATPIDADALVWIDVVGRLGALDDFYRGTGPRQAKFRAFAIKLIRPVFDTMGWEPKPNETSNQARLRQSLIRALGQFGDPAIIAEARQRFDAFLAKPESLPAALRQTVLSVTAMHADAATFEKLLALAQAAPSELERSQNYRALAGVRDPALAQRLRERLLEPEVPTSLTAVIMGGLSVEHPDSTYAFAKSQWATIKGRLDSLQVLRFLPDLVQGTFDPRVIEDMRTFAKTNLPPESSRGVAESESLASYRWKVRADRLPSVDGYLDGASR